MHEASLVHEVLVIAKEAAEAEGLSKITSIELIIGEHLCIMPDALEFAFRYMTSGPLLEKAELRWEIGAGRELQVTYIEGE
ncbi:hydrogenase maturation nickel metallochaperone HypA [Paenibacillus thiaminolyticus]|uniref:Hydrogenase maturation nickel metallochaperone HypA n=1 Tax=Paenibacillus thiaminolyticus TaxID=49283 RepID=A0AAP9DR60_PANTH|nr:hydrogenase maturation nickel metallochaperone HypA [Paenibacillus thiaminolyticus]MCY9538016.1 hydrogenase maturation nickel metallochaperone HypA [Paenibacillus thiaminolyticus]MCY9604918.1 hydrogenase maturation nickel metallochaperone HypA [Paenibacillus thiaminolyticus]MCY9610653.1 hydrogenase maturation nickel metallochaperone HypA [Paenibacillus thiaminolyticus]MCY9615981.1 hydrogenase maturation nickel metallochaperone HypA [Paenibacillus thiaminolyticus]MCY9622387.1 hydrogenase mat